MIDPRLMKIPHLFHFTDRRNLALIRALGGLFPLGELRRREVEIPAPGGNKWSHDADAMKGLEAYVHLCFRDNHPMEYIARKDGRIIESVFLQINPSVLHFDGVLFTFDVSNKSGVTPVPINEAAEKIDFEVLYSRTDWSDPEIKTRLGHVKKYEVLIPSPIPLKYIGGI